MAAEHRICVSVLEGAVVGLHEVGVPLPVCMHLQDKGARFESAQWTAKQTKSGFSVCFFWPVDEVAVAMPRKRRRRRRRSTKNRRAKSPVSVTSNELQPAKADERQPISMSAPIDAHHSGNTHHSLTAPEESKLKRASNQQEPSDQEELSDQENSSDELDLVTCKPVVFEMRQSTPGVQYVKDGEQNWTPVVRKRKRKRGKTMHTKESTSTSSSDSELDVGTARQVYYQEHGKVPGLYIRRGCTSSSVSWIPIAPSPVSSRTRARTKC